MVCLNRGELKGKKLETSKNKTATDVATPESPFISVSASTLGRAGVPLGEAQFKPDPAPCTSA